MKIFCLSWIWGWAGIGYAQDMVEAAQVAASSGGALTVGASDMTFPAALIIATSIIAKWTPKVRIELIDKRE